MNCWRFSAAMSDDTHQLPEIAMTTQAKLTDTQTAILKAAAGRPDGSIEPLPANLRGGARTKVIDGLLARGLIADADGHHLLTDAGYAAVGKRCPIPKGVQKLDAPDALTRSEPIPHTLRPGTKLAAIIDAMRNPDGATIAQMMAGTGWQAHSVRGAISGMVRKRLGYEVITEKGADGQRAYRIT
jgi:hypothetical protein